MTMEPRRGTEADQDRIVALVCHDLMNTVGAGHEAVVEEAAACARLFSEDLADFEQRVVDDVQQKLHDCFIDTCWPRCPAHPNHPLWYSGQAWTCEQTNTVFGQLGTLSYQSDAPGAS